MSFKHHWTISSSYDVEMHWQRSKTRCCFSQTALLWFNMLPGMSLVLPGAPRLIISAPRIVTNAPRSSQVYLKATTSVQATMGFDHPGILVGQLPNTARGSQREKFIVLMSNLLALCSWITILHARWHTVRNPPTWQAKDVKCIGHSGKDMTFTKVVMVGLKRSPLHSTQNNGPYLLVHPSCLLDCQETIHWIGQHLPALLLHLNHLPAHQGDPPSSFPWTDSGLKQNPMKRRSQGSRTHSHCWGSPTTNMVPTMGALIHWTWAIQVANPPSAWNKLHSPSSNLPNGWGRPTTVQSRSGWWYEWLAFWNNSIGPLSRGRTVSICIEMDPCSGKQWLQIIWWHSRTGSEWIHLNILNRFTSSGLRYIHDICKWIQDGKTKGKPR